ncbi:hypothetical protein HPULCUR_008322 [Helicostylum pulchrum]|uniref:Uncharacterized protein n=1 Tax=Helicostylum pulchrum TaxID=562976 RepID=A0ABP9Y7A2_9FUNG
MNYNAVKNIAKSYCYQDLCKGDPKWPDNIILPEGVTEDMMKNTIDQKCEPIRALIGQKVALTTLSSAPEKVHKCLKFILDQYDGHAHHCLFDVQRLPLPRLFHILPKPTVHWSVEQLLPNEDNNILFGNIVRSDEFCVDFLFYRRANKKDDGKHTISNHTLELKDFSIEEIVESFRPAFLDPGRKSVYTAAVGLDLNEHQEFLRARLQMLTPSARMLAI